MMPVFQKYIQTVRIILLCLICGATAPLISARFSESAAARIAEFAEHERGELRPALYSTPEEGVKALVEALSTNEGAKLLAVFGPGGEQLLDSGDAVADRAARQRFLAAYREKHSISMVSPTKAVLEVGNDSWPFPIPMEKVGPKWSFSATDGKIELLSRWIGSDELSAIEVCLAYVDAQREYASKDRNGDGVLEYAQKFLSDPGTKDGLYWETKEGEEKSPLGPLIGKAKSEGYREKSAGNPTPYHGYFYKILTSQGPNAPRGQYNYVINGRMIGGFAMVAYPATYGSSGIKTFIVNQDGVVYEKDLGLSTENVAPRMTSFDPDGSWRRVESKYVDVPMK
jgi:hypothetical protein